MKDVRVFFKCHTILLLDMIKSLLSFVLVYTVWAIIEWDFHKFFHMDYTKLLSNCQVPLCHAAKDRSTMTP